MQYLGTNFSLTLGAWRLRFVLALEDDPGEAPATNVHPERAPAERRIPHVVRIDPHAAANRRN